MLMRLIKKVEEVLSFPNLSKNNAKGSITTNMQLYHPNRPIATCVTELYDSGHYICKSKSKPDSDFK